MDWLDLLAVQGTLKSLLQNYSSKTSILRRSAFFIVQLSHTYMTTAKTIALERESERNKVGGGEKDRDRLGQKGKDKDRRMEKETQRDADRKSVV